MEISLQLLHIRSLYNVTDLFYRVGSTATTYDTTMLRIRVALSEASAFQVFLSLSAGFCFM